MTVADFHSGQEEEEEKKYYRSQWGTLNVWLPTSKYLIFC